MSRNRNRHREVILRVFGADRSLGVLHTDVHTDVRALVERFARDAKHKWRERARRASRLRSPLSPARIEAVDEALRSAGNIAGVDGLRALVQQWHAALQRWEVRDVVAHYDGNRAASYHRHNGTSQAVLTWRAMDIARGWERTAVTDENDYDDSTIYLDVGCGTGLSTVAIRGGLEGIDCASELTEKTVKNFGIGIDASMDMLSIAVTEAAASRCVCDFVQCDAAAPLPFRDNVFNLVVSVSAIHYVACRGRTEQLFSELRRCTELHRDNDEVTMQFFPESAADADEAARDARRAGWESAMAICDMPYNSNSKRWFLVASSTAARSTATAPATCPMFGNAPCCISYFAYRDASSSSAIARCSAHSSPFAWLVNEHARYCRRLIRKMNYIDGAKGRQSGINNADAVLDSRERTHAKRVWQHFGPRVSLDDLLNDIHSVIDLLHTATT